MWKKKDFRHNIFAPICCITFVNKKIILNPFWYHSSGTVLKIESLIILIRNKNSKRSSGESVWWSIRGLKRKNYFLQKILHTMVIIFIVGLYYVFYMWHSLLLGWSNVYFLNQENIHLFLTNFSKTCSCVSLFLSGMILV